MVRYNGSQLVANDLEHQLSHDKLLRIEIATLIGLMVQKPIDLSLPDPEDIQGYIERSEALLKELHHALMKPWVEGCNPNVTTPPEHDPFTTAEAMREPIFYDGESAYNFQYQSLSLLKYHGDKEWLEANKGFRIDEACQVAEALGILQLERQQECAQSLREKPPDQWTLLPGFMFTTQDAAKASGVAIERVERFLNAFSCGPHERNDSFTALNEFNSINAMPIINLDDGSYILLQHYCLLEAIYETPFFWMANDNAYASKAFDNRGRFTEGFAADRLEAVFGADRVFRNVDIYKGKNRYGEADVLVLYGDRAIVVQAKSKRLTIEARKGNNRKLKDDFKKAIQNSCDQALLCAEALTNYGYKFVSSSGVEIEIGDKPRAVFPICIVSDHYPALTFQARQFLKAKVTASIQPTLASDVFTLDVFAEMLSTPLHFLNYLALRAQFGAKLIVSDELTILGCHLKHNLWINKQYDFVNLDEDFTSELEIAMLARRTHVPGEKTPKGILTRFDDLTIGRLVTEIERAAFPQLTGLGLLLLQLNSETAKFLSSGIDRIVREAQSDGKNHNISAAVDNGGIGITIHCNDRTEDIAQKHLSTHCKFRKYDSKANAWYGLLLDPSTGRPRSAVAIQEDWKPDPQMDAALSVWSVRPLVPISEIAKKPRKIGRNDPCPCGSGKKYKKCCLHI